jgi:hypothetical protein
VQQTLIEEPRWLVACLLRLAYPALAETFLAGGRIDFAARFRWLLDLLKPRAITGGANNFGKNLTPLFHEDQSLKHKFKSICWKIAVSRSGATKLPS